MKLFFKNLLTLSLYSPKIYDKLNSVELKASMTTEPITNFSESRGWCDPGKGL